jgi:hypothetical protein
LAYQVCSLQFSQATLCLPSNYKKGSLLASVEGLKNVKWNTCDREREREEERERERKRERERGREI